MKVVLSSHTTSGACIELTIFPDSLHDYLGVISDDDAEAWGEASVQIQEGGYYHYETSPGFQLDGVPRIIQPFLHPSNNTGLIKPGNFVGTLVFTGSRIEDSSDKGSFSIEVRSIKTDYRTEYRFMLQDIAEFSIDLVLKHSSPIIQSIVPTHDLAPRSLYQKFAFINSIIGTDEFFEALDRIVRLPVTNWSSKEYITKVEKARKPTRHLANQISTSKNRIPLPAGTQSGLSSLPRNISCFIKSESIDTPENQFVKYVLNEYLFVCELVNEKLVQGSIEKAQADHLVSRIRDYVDRPSFKEISAPHTLTLNSQILQKKEGYREVYRSWLMFDIGSKLTWEGGEDVFFAGKKDVAKLYEYWVYLKLLEIISSVFPGFSDSYLELIKPCSDGLLLNLKSRINTNISRLCKYDTRQIHVVFSFNRTFSGTDFDNYPSKGSWTRSMRPDYSLSFWPHGFTQQEAEEQELITHIHFDAKYRINQITDAFGPEDEIEDIDDFDSEQNVKNFKRLDLIKMHAYKDAIRRSAGAYILYPGSENKAWRGYHEVIPGLGAFTVRPTKGNEGIEELRKFLLDVVEQLLNRASKYETTTYHLYNTYSSPPITVREPLPEKIKDIRLKPPTDIRCMVGYCKNLEHMIWIENNGLYNIRISMEAKDRALDKSRMDFFGLSYLLLYGKEGVEHGRMFEITDPIPDIMTKSDLLEIGYPNPRHEQYLVFKIKPSSDPIIGGTSWKLNESVQFLKTKVNYSPYVASLADIVALP